MKRYKSVLEMVKDICDDESFYLELKAAIEEAGQIQRGEVEASRTYTFNNAAEFLAKHGDWDGEYVCVGSPEHAARFNREVRLVKKRQRSLWRRMWNMFRRR